MPNSDQNFEEKLQKTNQIIEALSTSDLPLDKSVSLYKEGMQILQAATKELNDAKLEFEKIESNYNGNSEL
jgi:exodeoxyribonuclease VII small subunit